MKRGEGQKRRRRDGEERRGSAASVAPPPPALGQAWPAPGFSTRAMRAQWRGPGQRGPSVDLSEACGTRATACIGTLPPPLARGLGREVKKAQEKLLCGQALPGKSSPQKGGKTEKRVGEGSRKMLARRPLAPGQFPSQAWEGENSRMDRGNTLRRGGLVSNAQGGEFDPGARLRPGDIPWRKKGG